MIGTLIKTKLNIPQIRRDRVKRTRIISALNQGLSYPLILLSSMPGSGKTTALAEWVNQLSVPVAWISLDESDNDPTRFLSYFAAALKSITSGGGPIPPGELNLPEPLSTNHVMNSLINDLCEKDGEFVLVLDDYHIIQSHPIQSAISYFLDHLPPQAHLVIATRTDPNLPLSRLRVRDQILELRMDDLRFTSPETDEFLSLMGLNLSQSDLTALEARTEGWIASLQMAALSLKHTPDAKGFIQAFSGSNRYVMDYLVEEVLNRQPEPVQKFLLQTSILERLNGELCDAVCAGRQETKESDPANLTPPGKGQEMLEFLERSNLFTIPLDEERHWYRYHHLFASLLRARLVHSKVYQINELHLRAAAWYEKAGTLEEAIQHALFAQDFPHAASLIESVAETEWLNGQYSRLIRWIKALPDDLALNRPWMCVWMAWSISQIGVPKDADEWVEAAEKAARKQNLDLSAPYSASSPEQILKYHITALKVLTACLSQDYDRAVQLSAWVLENPPPEGIQSAQIAQCHIYHALNYKYFMDCDLAKTEQTSLEVMRLSREIGFTLRQLHGANMAAYGYILSGQLQRCYRLLQETFSYLQGQGRSGYFAAVSLRCREVDLLYEWDQIEGSRRIMEDHLQPEKLLDVPPLQVDVYNIRARDDLLKKDYPAAQNALNKASALAQKSYIWPGLVRQTEALQVMLWLQDGNIALAAAWASELPAKLSEMELFSSEASEISQARILMACDDHQDPGHQPAQSAGGVSGSWREEWQPG